MTESLSQDELDALLADMGGGDGASSEEGGQELPASWQKAIGDLSSSFQGGAGNLGVMLATTSSAGEVQATSASAGDLQDLLGSGFVLFQTDLSGPAEGPLCLALPEDGVRKLIATATGSEEGDVAFDEDQMGAAVEILSPVLVGVGKTLSSLAGGTYSTGPVSGQTGSEAIPSMDGQFLVLKAALNIENIMEGETFLLVPEKLFQAQEAPSPGTGDSALTVAGSSAPASREEKKQSLARQNLNLLLDVQMPLTVELGRTRKYVKEILGLGEGSIIELDKQAGEPVDLMVNKKLIAKGEVVVIDENFGVRVTDIVSPKERLKLG